MIDSLVKASRSALRHLRTGGERDADIFVGDAGGRGFARGYIRACDRRHLARSWSRVDHGHQLEFDPDRSRQHGDIHQQRCPHRGNHLGQHIDQHHGVRACSASLFIYPRRLDSLHHCWRRHRQHLFECPEFLRGAHIDAVVHQYSTAGNAVITNNASGFSAVTSFFNSSTAGNATISNTNLGFTSFNDTSTAGNATITSGSRGFVAFLGSATAGNANITNNALGSATFSNSSTAVTATITTNIGGFTTFTNTSTAGNATVITNNGGTTQFSQFGTAGNAIVITNSGGTTQFSGFSTGGNAAFTTQAGGVFDMSGVFLGMTAGSIAGAGTYFLGSNALILGGNNLSTTVDGTISDGGAAGGRGGSLVKVGSGILTLAGANTYTGATVVNAGVLV